jgi:hypothetical protein
LGCLPHIGAAIGIGTRDWWVVLFSAWLASMSAACFRLIYPTGESVGDAPYSPGEPPPGSLDATGVEVDAEPGGQILVAGDIDPRQLSEHFV